TFHWINKPETKKLFKFLNPHLKILDHWSLSEKILEAAISEVNKAIQDIIHKDKI
ncbi:35223_t:CDS:1, partial [Racocetra persica]